MSETADGQMKALQVGHQIATQQVAQTQKLRGLVSQQMTMMGTWFQSEQTQKDLAQARREKFFNATTATFAVDRKWSRAGEQHPYLDLVWRSACLFAAGIIAWVWTASFGRG